VPVASIVIPTRNRHRYLEATLDSVLPQAVRAGAEVIVVNDGSDADTACIAARPGIRHVARSPAQGINAARNLGARQSTASLIVLIDDDVQAPPGWLHSLLAGVRAAEDREVFGGPIVARLEGGPRACGREPPPITSLDLGPRDRDVAYVWGANMAIRRSALERIGPFDESLSGRGDEEEWEDRYKLSGGRIRYLAAAWLYHRRDRTDSRLPGLVAASYHVGQAARRNDVRKGTPPPLRAEVRVLAGCAWHTIRRRCGYGVVMGAEAAGRVRQALVAGGDE